MNNAPRPSQRSTAAVIVQSLLWLWLIGLSVFVALNHQAMNGLADQERVDSGLQQLIPEVDLLSYDTYFVYPDELRNSARVHAFRDFLVSKAQRWSY